MIFHKDIPKLYTRIILVFCFILFYSKVSGQSYTVSGFIFNEDTKEKLLGASIYENESKRGISSNNFGFYSIELPTKDSVELIVSFVGYSTQVKTIKLKSDVSIDFYLKTDTTLLNTIEIVSQNSIESNTEISTITLPIEMISQLPAFFGEVDIMRTFQLMPGVQSGREGTNAMYVRGGGPDQNLILLDDVPLYYVNHMGGFVSVFDLSTVSKATLIKGGFPARYGGRLSSVLDVRLKDGNSKQMKGVFTLGTLASKISVEGPINSKTTYLFSARRSLFDIFSRIYTSLQYNGDFTAGYYLYDLNGKITHRISNKDRLYFQTYIGGDKSLFKSKTRDDNAVYKTNNTIRWGNFMALIRWNHVYSKKLFSNFSIAKTNFYYSTKALASKKLLSDNTEINATNSFDSKLGDWITKLDFDYYHSASHSVKFGAAASIHSFTPTIITFKDTISNFPYKNSLSNNIKAYEASIYGEDIYTITNKFSVNLGLRSTLYNVEGSNWISIEPRVVANMKLDNAFSVKGSFSKMTQFIHLLSNSGAGLPTDIWVPATPQAPPENSYLTVVGIAKSFNDRKLMELSVEAFYKQLDGLVEFKEGSSFFAGTANWQNKIETGGQARIYGLELLLQKKEGLFTGWLGYTLSKNTRQFNNLNNGKPFPYKFDRRHDISVVGIYSISKKISISATWVYGTGNSITLAQQKYSLYVLDKNEQFDFNQFNDANLYLGRNSYRVPSYHRLDIAAKIEKVKKNHVSIWNFGIYNVYNRNNPYYLFYSKRNTGKLGLYQLSLFSIMPTISYTTKF